MMKYNSQCENGLEVKERLKVLIKSKSIPATSLGMELDWLAQRLAGKCRQTFVGNERSDEERLLCSVQHFSWNYNFDEPLEY